jgi:endonuclease/exonuclease/phosphatase family metal-dependent hydrolase
MLTKPRSCRTGRIVLVLGAAVMAAGCAGQGPVAEPGSGDPVITLDGDLSDWPSGIAAIADGDYLYIRTTLDGPARTLQAMQDRTLELWIDADSSAATGATEPAPRAAAALGVDLEVQFSPLVDGHPDVGTAVAVPVAGGQRITLGHADVGLMFLPTYAASEFEIRLSRHAAEVPGGLAGGVLSGEGTATLMLVLVDGTGKPKGWSDPFSVAMPARSAERPRTDATIPVKDDGQVRVMSWNVLKSSPLSKPDAFARVIQAVAPDIISFQEWDQGDAVAIEAWLNARVPGSGEWSVVKGAGQGVAIASRFPMRPIGPGRIMLDSGENAHPIRFVAAMVGTAAGQVIVGSTHLKCCGFIDSSEDQRRMAEAGAINAALKSAFDGAAGAAGMRVITGDMNLVGSRPPLDVLRAGLDADGTEMDVVEAMVLGDRAMYTWSEAGNQFSPGRLDFAVVGDSATEVVRSFVLDLSLMSDTALAKMGLDRADATVSDHLPVIVDVKSR